MVVALGTMTSLLIWVGNTKYNKVQAAYLQTSKSMPVAIYEDDSDL